MDDKLVGNDQLAQFLAEFAFEGGIDDELLTVEDADYSFFDADFEIIGTDGSVIEIEGTTEASWQKQTTRARYNPPSKAHPAEYETKTMPIVIVIRVDTDSFSSTIEVYDA